jgi:hypothetical protein
MAGAVGAEHRERILRRASRRRSKPGRWKDHQPIANSLGVFTPLSAESPMSTAFSPEQRKRLIANGTYNTDGTVNLETARKLGWTSLWEHKSDLPAARVSNKPE